MQAIFYLILRYNEYAAVIFMHFKSAIVGGTFDHFHAGHKQLLDTAFAQSESVTIGISTESLLKNKTLRETIEPYNIRELHVRDFVRERSNNKSTKIVPLANIYGISLEKKDIEALFITHENIQNARKLNAKRLEIGFPALQNVLVPYVNDHNGGIISSERIRLGEIDADGHVYANIFSGITQLLLPETLREELRRPFGQVIATDEQIEQHLRKTHFIISVGDIITRALVTKGIQPSVSIIDKKSRRHALHDLTPSMPAQPIKSRCMSNPPGTIQSSAILEFIQALAAYRTNGIAQELIIDGEEDLLALPTMLLAPLSSVVLYGQIDKGIVVNRVTGDLKNKTEDLLRRFEKK